MSDNLVRRLTIRGVVPPSDLLDEPVGPAAAEPVPPRPTAQDATTEDATAGDLTTGDPTAPGEGESDQCPPPITVTTVGRAWRALVEAVADELEGRQRLWVLEAGAGRRTLFDLPEDAYIVGVDRDRDALEQNIRLDERIAADLTYFRPRVAGFDVITCWYLLDGLSAPVPVLDRFARWTGPGGLIVLGVPNLRSPRGLLARASGRLALRRALTPNALRRRFAAAGFTPVFQAFFEDADQAAVRRRWRVTNGRWQAAQALVRIASFGLLDAARTDYLAIFRRDR